MTEAEWLVCTEPLELLECSRGKGDTRKCRLFAVACCRSIGQLLIDARSVLAVDTAEMFADGLSTLSELAIAGEAADDLWNAACVGDDERFDDATTDAACAAAGSTHPDDATDAARMTVQSAAGAMSYSDREESEHKNQLQFLRDIFGNPFRPVAVDPAWLTSDVVAMARGMYETRDFAAMPILTDALQDAGCENADILTHCCGDGPHIRGCWVVDLMLGKE